LKGQKVERGIIQTPSPVPVALLFERFPIWLLTLAPNQVSHLTVLGYNTRDDFALSCDSKGSGFGLIDAALGNLGSDKVTYKINPTPPKGAIYLVSGVTTTSKHGHKNFRTP
jgi:hypothetical protein